MVNIANATEKDYAMFGFSSEQVLANRLHFIRKSLEVDDREFPCESCDEGEYVAKSTSPSGITQYKCNACGHGVSFP